MKRTFKPTDASTTAAAHRPRIGLAWRAITLTSLLLLGIASLFTIISHNNLTQQFQQSRMAMYHAREHELSLTVTKSADALALLAGLTAASDKLGHAMLDDNPLAVTQAIEPVWPTLQLDAGIDELLVVNDQGRILTARGQPLSGDSERPLSTWVRQVMATEIPISTLRCIQDCRQYVAVPVLVEGASVGLVVISRSLAEVTRYAQGVSQSDVALLVTDGQTITPSQDARYIAPWNGSLVTLTHEEQSLPVIELAAAQVDLARLKGQPWQFKRQGQTYELTAIGMSDSADYSSKGYLLLISNITAQVEAIESETRHTLLMALSGWLAAEILLLLILWRPMARLRRLAALLPKLARREFHTVRQVIEATKRRRFSDETDTLELTTLALANQLETLEGAVSSRDRELTQRLSELSRERDFISGLLDTAHVLILTQDSAGHIMLVNHYAEAMTGRYSSALLGRRFGDIFMLEEPDRQRPFDRPSQEEGIMFGHDRKRRTIAWYHSPMPGEGQSTGILISVGLDISDRKTAEQRLAWLANRDPLTDLYNRRFFQDSLEQALMPGAQGAVLFLDLDQFKEVNELSGHHSGDQLLRMVAKALTTEFEHEAIITRLGGDEFAILLENVGAEQATQVAERTARTLEQINFSVNGRRHRAVGSIGIALYPDHGATPTDLMASADFAMYKAKESGAQRWYLFSVVSHSKEELQQRVFWVERIRDALRDDDFELLLQPIARISDNRILHYEALLRMHGDNGAFVMPSLFIPIAERSGQIVELDRWVLKKGLKLLSRLQLEDIGLAINLSGQSLHDANLTEFLRQELIASGADAERLILEVTETAAVTDFATARGVMQGIRDLGCKTALDDFGVGFSSFHYLGQLPADYIKIDGSFIQKLLTSAEDRLIVKAIADIATGFGKQAVAEFVDNPEMLPILRDYGIAYAQGYHIGRPVPVSEVFESYRRLEMPEEEQSTSDRDSSS